MLTEEDLDHYMIWNGYTAQSREATRPELVVAFAGSPRWGSPAHLFRRL